MEHKAVIFSIMRRTISRNKTGTISADRHVLRNIKTQYTEKSFELQTIQAGNNSIDCINIQTSSCQHFIPEQAEAPYIAFTTVIVGFTGSALENMQY